LTSVDNGRSGNPVDKMLTPAGRRTVAAVAGQAFFLVKQGVGGPTCNFAPRPVVMESPWSELRRAA
jgi:hypothetical protein